MPNPYAVKLSDNSGVERIVGDLVFADPRNQPGGVSTEVLCAALGVGGSFAQNFGSNLIPLVAVANPVDLPVTVSFGPVTLAPGGDFAAGVSTPIYSAGTVELTYLEILVSNAAGTEKLDMEGFPNPPIALASQVDYFPDLTDAAIWAALETVGADLSPHTSGRIISAAGGQYFVSAQVTLRASGVTP